MTFDPHLKDVARHQDAIDRLAAIERQLEDDRQAAIWRQERPLRLALLIVVFGIVAYAAIRL